MPPASIGLRGLAFLLDFILISAVASSSSGRSPSHSRIPPHSLNYRNGHRHSLGMATKPLQLMHLPEPGKNLVTLTIANELQMLCFWLYFSVGEAFFAGSSWANAFAAFVA